MTDKQIIGEYKLQVMKRIDISSLKRREEEIKYGGKIILPVSALEKATRLRSLPSPMIFCLSVAGSDKPVFCGCISFEGAPNTVIVPNWMMKQLELKPGRKVQVSVLKKNPTSGSFCKFQPQESAFFEVTNPKAILEHTLRNFDCISQDDVIEINYNSRVYNLLVVKTTPQPSILIVNCDLEVDFCELESTDPCGTVTSKKKSGQQEIVTGYRLDGSPITPKQAELERTLSQEKEHQRGIPDYGHCVQELDFIRGAPKPKKTKEEKKSYNIRKRLVDKPTIDKDEVDGDESKSPSKQDRKD